MSPTTRCALVLGTSRPNSVGWAIARALAADGLAVVGTCRPGRAADLRPAAQDAGMEDILEVDADRPTTLSGAVQDLQDRWGRLDVLVHTWMHVPEGVLARPLTALDRAAFDAAMGPGVFGYIDAVSRTLPLLQQGQRPRVLALSSACRHRMTPRYHIAGIAKAALSGAVLYMAQELGPQGIACNALSFSYLATDGAERVVGSQASQATVGHLARKAPLHGGIDMGAVARAAVWLCTGADGMTAETIEIDGGFSHRYF